MALFLWEGYVIPTHKCNMHLSSPFLHPQRVRNCYAPPITRHKGYCHTLSPIARICSWQPAGALVWAFYGVAPIAGQSTLLQRHTALRRSTSTEIWYLQRKHVIFLCSRGINWCKGQLNQKNTKRGEKNVSICFKTFSIWGLPLSTEEACNEPSCFWFRCESVSIGTSRQAFSHLTRMGPCGPVCFQRNCSSFFLLSPYLEMHLKGKMTRLPSYCNYMWLSFQLPSELTVN